MQEEFDTIESSGSLAPRVQIGVQSKARRYEGLHSEVRGGLCRNVRYCCEADRILRHVTKSSSSSETLLC